MEKTGLVLEGGAMRSLFSAGVLDYFMEKGLNIPTTVTVSAGAYAAINYLSGQIGRTVQTNIEPFYKESYVGVKTFLKKGTLFDMEKLFDIFPNKEYPFDYDAFFASDKKLVMTTTNCITGEAIYFDEYGDKDRMMKICQASNSLPFIARIVEIDGIPMLDGGMADAIPVNKAVDMGLNKLVLIMTRRPDYRKKTSLWYLTNIAIVYHRFPEFVKAVRRRANVYNQSVEMVEQLEREGKAFVIRPLIKPIKNNETNPEKLRAFYEHGKDVARAQFEDLMKFLQKDIVE